MAAIPDIATRIMAAAAMAQLTDTRPVTATRKAEIPAARISRNDRQTRPRHVAPAPRKLARLLEFRHENPYRRSNYVGGFGGRSCRRCSRTVALRDVLAHVPLKIIADIGLALRLRRKALLATDHRGSRRSRAALSPGQRKGPVIRDVLAGLPIGKIAHFG